LRAGDPHLAEELVQSFFAKLHLKDHALNALHPSKGQLRSWLLTCLLAVVATLWWVNRPPEFPKRFDRRKIRVNDGRAHFIRIDMTLRESGKFLAKIRTTCLDPFFGFDGKTEMVFRDDKGNIIHQLTTSGHGVNGRFIPGGKHDRIDDWHFTVPPEVARDVATINFHSTPSAKGIEHRIRMNQGDIREDVDALKAGAAKGLEAIHRIPISEVSPEAPWQSGFAGAPKTRCLACLPLPP
jgi:hypothetical protein